MKKSILKKSTSVFACIMVVSASLTGCVQTDNQYTSDNDNKSNSSATLESEYEESYSSISSSYIETSESSETAVTQLEIRFGDEGEPFIMNLHNNDTAEAIARHIGTADWRLPIYNDDDYENKEIMQYYDIPSRYEIPSNPETITKAIAGEVYYSDPNRIVLFYQEGEVSGEYTRIGYFDPSEEFVAAITNNPVLEGWGNKIVLIRTSDQGLSEKSNS